MTDQTQITLSTAIKKSAIGLAIFAFFTAGIISVTQFLTKAPISSNEQQFEARLLISLLPANQYSPEALLASATTFDSLSLTDFSLLSLPNSESFYRAQNQSGQTDIVILPVNAPEGYTEAIRMVVGIHRSGELVGVRVTRHKETPGLGDGIEIAKSDWITAFNGKSLSQPALEGWAVKKDGGQFDQMTGATITPRAVVKAVKQSLQFFETNKAVLLANSTTTEIDSVESKG